MRKNKRGNMKRIREILKMSMVNKMSNRIIAQALSVSHTSVNTYLMKVIGKGINDFSEIEKLNDEQLKQIIFEEKLKEKKLEEVDYEQLHKEMKKKSVTLKLLWEEYKENSSEGYSYSHFSALYRKWKRCLNVTLRQDYKAGEKGFIDYAGQTVDIIDRSTGEVHEAQIIIFILGASNYTYAEATFTQSLDDWINSHIRALEFFGGSPEIWIPDNLKSGVTKACRYEPLINQTYYEMASHYGAVVIPARSRKPRDKAKAENGVLIAERRILAKFRSRTFFSLDELNEAIFIELDKLNKEPFQKLEGSRESLFEEIEKKVLLPLPSRRYVKSEWKELTVHIDYHVEVDKQYYSVPYKLVGKKVSVRYTSATVEIFYDGKRVASHRRSYQKGKHTTLNEHMPKSHREYLKWSPKRITKWAAKSGPCTAKVVERIMNEKKHPAQGFRSCLGVMRLGQSYGFERLEAACKRALMIGGYGYRSIRSILEKGLDSQPLEMQQEQSNPIDHDNIRGSKYYH